MPEAFHVEFRVFGLRPSTCRTTADETKLPVAREKKPLVPRVRLEVNSTGSSLRSQSERAKTLSTVFEICGILAEESYRGTAPYGHLIYKATLLLHPVCFFMGKENPVYAATSLQ